MGCANGFWHAHRPVAFRYSLDDPRTLVPTLRVGMPSSTLRVVFWNQTQQKTHATKPRETPRAEPELLDWRIAHDAERRPRHSHAGAWERVRLYVGAFSAQCAHLWTRSHGPPWECRLRRSASGLRLGRVTKLPRQMPESVGQPCATAASSVGSGTAGVRPLR